MKRAELEVGTKKVMFMIILIAVLIILLLSVTFVSTGEAFRSKFKLKIALSEPIFLKDGCYIKINNDAAYWLTSDKKECKSLYIASNYVGRSDFYRLLYSLGYPSAPVSKSGLEKVNSEVQSEAEKVTLTNTSNKFTILYSYGNNLDDFSSIKPSSSAPVCQELEFFGVKLFCFNGVIGKKENNLPQIITYFTVLKYTSNQKVMNGLVGKEVYPINFIADNSIKYYDASAPELYGETLDSVKCLPEQGPANYQLHNGESRVYICQKYLTGTTKMPKKLNNVAILYHEANHKYDSHRCWHQEDLKYDMKELLEQNIVISSTCNCNQPPKESPPKEVKNSRDWDFNTIYGTHINYLLSMSQNEILPCEWRTFAFERAEQEMKTKLCQKPNKPKISDTKPDCD